MAGYGHQPSQPFTNDEKNHVLAEIIKASAIPHEHLLAFCNHHIQHQPNFEDVIPPPGRTARECRGAWDRMRQASMYSPVSQAGSGPTPLSAPMPSLRRSTGGLESSYSAAGRPLMPKTSGYGYPINIAEPPLKRKRGRPTKAEQQARAAEQAGESSSIGARFQTPLSASMPPSPSVDTRPVATQPPVSRMPISAIVSTPTAAPKSASHSSSSSGKRRRRRRSEEQAALDSGSSHNFASPFARGPPDDTPARSITARRRDDPTHSSITRLAVSEPEASLGAQSSTPPGPSYGGPS